MARTFSTVRIATVSCSIVAISLLGIVGCSSSSPGASGTGGSGSGGAIASGGTGGSSVFTASTGGVTQSSGGATPGSGGAATGSGGATGGTGAASGTGGKTNGAGGSTTGTGMGGTSTTGLGGAASGGAAGGASGPGAGRDGGPLGGAGPDAATGAGGRIGQGGSTGVTVDSGSSGGPSSGCGKSTAKPNRKTQQTITIGGTTRYYLLNVPTSADANTPLPLVLALHGYDMNNVALVDLYDFTTESGNKAITVLPQGEGPEPGTTSHWGDSVLKSTWTANTANYDFMQQLAADIESKYCVDTERVYMTGFSMGGMFTNSLACDHNAWFRGYAPVEGGGPGTCSHADAKPAIIIHQGTADTTATPAKGGEPTRDFWTKQNGCNTTTTAIYTGCQSYGACSEPVLYCVGNWTHTVDRIARGNIWKFFDSLK